MAWLHPIGMPANRILNYVRQQAARTGIDKIEKQITGKVCDLSSPEKFESARYIKPESENI